MNWLEVSLTVNGELAEALRVDKLPASVSLLLPSMEDTPRAAALVPHAEKLARGVQNTEIADGPAAGREEFQVVPKACARRRKSFCPAWAISAR